MLVAIRPCFRGLLSAAFLLAFVNATRAADNDAPKVTKLPPVTEDAASGGATQAKAAAPASAETSAADKADKSAKDKPAAAAKPKHHRKQLSPEMTERRDRVRRLLTALRQQPFNTQQNDCGEILEFCRGFGCDTELLDNAATGQKVNGITCLCWDMSCGGYEMMTASEGHLTARIGYGCQSQPSELAAVLALSEVPANYPARVGKYVRSVADLIEYEKLTCRPGTDMSLKLVALSHYVREPSWKDNQGGQWTLRRMVSEELNRPAGSYPFAATNRLLGLVCALDRFKTDKAAIDGELARAASYLDEATTYAFSSQNPDGSWGRAAGRDYASAVTSTAHMLEWLMPSLPPARMEDPRIAGGIDFLTTSFNAPHYQAYISTMNMREISAAMHAAYALNFYDQAVFVPADPPAEAAPAKEEKAEPKAAARSTEAR